MSDFIQIDIEDLEALVGISSKEEDVTPIETKPIVRPYNIKNPSINLDAIRARGDFWSKPEYDFAEIDRFADAESYLQQSFQKKLNLLIKEGWDIVGSNPEYVSYIEKRLNQICYVSKTSVKSLIKTIADDLNKYSNCFIAIVRKEESSGGYRYKDPRTNMNMQPIAGLFVLPASTIEIKVDEQGHIKKYRQWVMTRAFRRDSVKKEYEPHEILHFSVNHRPGLTIGTPKCLPVMEDIKALRRIEENIEILISQSIFPIIHYKVGTDAAPARITPDGISELDAVIEKLNNQPPEGTYVTSERHEIKMIGSEGRALRAETYLEHFKKRVLAGLSMSSVDVGEGNTANRSTAETMSRALVDEVKSLQIQLEDSFCRLLIEQLLMEAGQQIDIMDEANRVYLKFKEIDHEMKIKKENHNVQMFSQNAITHDELRMSIGKKSMTEEEWEQSFQKKIKEAQLLLAGASNPSSPLAYAAARSEDTPVDEDDLMEAKENANRAAASRISNLQDRPDPAQRAGANKANPRNQYSEDSWSINDSVKFAAILDNEISKVKYALRSDFLEKGKVGKEFEVKFGLLADMARKRVNKMVVDKFNTGLKTAGVSIDLSRTEDFYLLESSKAKRYAEKYVNKLFVDIESISLKKKTKEEIFAAIDSIKYRLNFIERTEGARSFNWGVIAGLKELEYKEYSIDINEDSDPFEIEQSKKVFPIERARIDNIPPWHPNSTIKVVKPKREA